MTIGKPFKKGQSGNPGGRPKVVAEVKELARAHTDKAIETLVSIMTNPKAAPATALVVLRMEPFLSLSLGGHLRRWADVLPTTMLFQDRESLLDEETKHVTTV